LYYEGNLDKGLTKFNLLAAFSNRRFGANGFYASPDFMDQYEEVQTSIVSLGATRSLKNGFIKSRIYWRRNQDDYEFIRNKPEIFRNLHLSQVYGVDLNSSIETGIGKTGIGLDVYQTQLFSNNLGEQKRTSIQFFAEHEFKLLADKLVIVPGISASYYSDFGAKAFPGVEVAYFVNENLSILGNTGGTFRIPSFTDLYYDGPQNIGNANLNPEEAFSYDIGIKYVKQSFSVQANYFSRASKNLIDWAKETEAQEQWQPLNFNSVNFSGVDFSLKWRNTNTSNNIKLNAIGLGGTFINSSIDENATFLSNYALQNVKSSLVLNAEIQWFKGFSQSIRARVLERELLDDYQVLDMAFFYKKDAFQFNFKVSNVFSEVYRATNLVTMPERWIKIGLDYTFNL
jgi:iron complex outermembrane receptor protein